MGKSWGKDGGKAVGKGAFKGNCYNCGKPGHRSAECRGPKATNAVEEGEWTEGAPSVIGSAFWNMCVEK